MMTWYDNAKKRKITDKKKIHLRWFIIFSVYKCRKFKASKQSAVHSLFVHFPNFTSPCIHLHSLLYTDDFSIFFSCLLSERETISTSIFRSLAVLLNEIQRQIFHENIFMGMLELYKDFCRFICSLVWLRWLFIFIFTSSTDVNYINSFKKTEAYNYFDLIVIHCVDFPCAWILSREKSGERISKENRIFFQFSVKNNAMSLYFGWKKEKDPFIHFYPCLLINSILKCENSVRLVQKCFYFEGNRINVCAMSWFAEIETRL